jgi:type II secretory ATPase GspE/PulE/Tfp pilus assembly ATPase PilB-like protein
MYNDNYYYQQDSLLLCMFEAKSKNIANILLEQQIITDDQLQIALIEQQKNSAQLESILINLGFVSEAVIQDILSQSLGVYKEDLSNFVAENDAIQLIPKSFATRYTILPLNFDKKSNTLSVAMADIFNIFIIDKLKHLLNDSIKIEPILASQADIVAAIDYCYGFELSIDGILHEIETGTFEFQADDYQQPLVRLVDALLANAIKHGASDIHLEPEQGFLRVRYRIDGVLQQIRSLHNKYWAAIVVRIKVMANLNIAEKRVPQDGRFSLNIAGKTIDFRVSVHPTIHGENIVLRILDHNKAVITIEQLDLLEHNLTLLKRMVFNPQGIVLITGPTGSGKTTSLYSLLQYLNTEQVGIMTLEDPVEYVLPVVRQTAINEAVKLDFATGLRSILRQDPDIILLGEIRDKATADMAFRTSMTGHKVYSTLHTNSAVNAIPRLLDLDVVADVIAENLVGVVGQRLVRKLCPACKQAYSPNDEERQLLNLSKDVTFYKAVGCEQCFQYGYKGRIALMEFLYIDNKLQQLIASKAATYKIKQYAQDNGFTSLKQEAKRRLLDGKTSLDEIWRVVGVY